MSEPLPEYVRRFVDAHVETIDQLEVLRLLWEDPAAAWTEAGLAAQVQAESAALAPQLAALVARGLVRAEAGPAYRHGPRDPEVGRALDEVLQRYRERPVSMIKLVAARAKDPLRSFADAFRVRPREGG